MRKALAVMALAALAANGTALAADLKVGKTKYDQLCVTCHGANGAGDGPASGALNPKPRAFNSAEWQASVTDDHIRVVTAKGGAAAGLSPIMPALGAGLKPAELDAVVAYIRTMGQ